MIKLTCFIARFLLWFRYRIRLKGLDQLKKLGNKKILFLPNHPAEVDPVMIMGFLGASFKPRPLVVEYFYHMSGAKFFMKLFGSLPVPNFDTSASEWKMRRVEEVMSEVKQGLEKGENFLIYPSGHLQRQAKTTVGGSSFTHRVVQECPDVQVVLVRFDGLWGSTFSRAITGYVPDFWNTLWHGIKVILKNGFLFAPRRDVSIEFKVCGDELPRDANRLDFNKWLENWYNANDEQLKLVTFSHFKTDLPEVTYKEREKKDHLDVDIPKEMREFVTEELKKLSDQTPIEDGMELASDLALDSLDIANVHAALDRKYDLGDVTPGDLYTVLDLYEAALGEKETLGDEAPKEMGNWPEETDRPPILGPLGETLPESFFKVAARMGNHTACADANSGVLSYKRFKLGVMIMARKIEKMPGKYVGILLPSSVGAYMMLLACLTAKKIPVMLNWTAGLRSLNYAGKLLEMETVLTSRKFIDRVEGLELGVLEDKLVYLEDVKSSVSLFDKLGALVSGPGSFNINSIKPDDPAVILFTSGTESYPKAVPLSHKNLLENQRAALTAVEVQPTDVLYGVLPPFHSFGCSVTGLMPLLSGMRVYFAPDPTDSNSMAADVEHWKISILASAPSFLRNLFHVAEKKQLGSVRLFVAGAEKAPPELFEMVRGMDRELVEGYGITECSPMVSITPLHETGRGVGKPIPGVSLSVINVETQTPEPEGSKGEICIKGPSVFSGYLGPSGKNPFIQIEGERWYRSGDIGFIDDDGFLILEGRIKRFVKIGGEMVSLGALEDELAASSRKENWNPMEDNRASMALAVKEEEGRPELILFTTFNVSKEKVNTALRNAGFARIVKISEVRTLPEIPLTGTGKVHFRRLDELVYA